MKRRCDSQAETTVESRIPGCLSHRVLTLKRVRTFEYRSVHVPSAGGSDLVRLLDVDELNALGADGWEAFAAVPAALDGYAYLVTDGVHVLLRRTVLHAA
jgi:hypothetical protein